MKPSKKPRIKICCISSIDEARSAIEFGASAVGLVSSMPSGPGVIADEKIAEIAVTIPPPVASFLLTSKTDAYQIIEQIKKAKTSTVQIVDSLLTGNYQNIRDELPNIKIVQVIHVIDESSIDDALSAAKYVDAILLDSGNPNLKIKELGGTGRQHNWEISRKIRELLDIPLFLAGGINPSNVKLAFEKVEPFGIDICSGVRTGGMLDLEKLGDFFSAVNSI